MYNRYIPSADGTYRRQIVPSAEKPQEEKVAASRQERSSQVCQSKPVQAALKPDTGDILVLLILLLVLLEGEDTDPVSILIALAAFFLMQ